MATQVTTGLLANNAVTDDKLHADFTATTQSASDNSTSVATTAYVTTAIANLADSAPSTLNTLNELAAALGDDANFSTTVTNSIATKLPLAGGDLTGRITITAADPGDNVSRLLDIKDSTAVAANVGGGISFFGKYQGSSYSTFGQILGSKTNATSGDYSGYLAFKTRPNNALPVERMRIDSSGLVGIGTSSPSTLLTVGDGTGTEYITIDKSTTGESGILFKNAGNNKGKILLDSNEHLRFYVNNTTNAMTILEDGNVGIGVASPGYKLHINSKLVVGDSPGVGLSGNTIHVRENSNSGIHFPLVIGGGTHVAGAAFGIGLDPEGYGNRNKIAILAEGNGAGYSRGKLHFAIEGSNNSDQADLSDSRMCIQEDGKVGIGITSPVSKVHIQGPSASTYTGNGPSDVLRVSSSSAGAWIASDFDGMFGYMGLDDSTTAKFAAYNYATSTEGNMILGQNRVYIKNNGNLIVGATSDSAAGGKFQVQASKSTTAGIPLGMVTIEDTASMAAGVGGSIVFTGAYLSNGTKTSLASVEGYKSNSTSGDYAGELVLKTRDNGGNAEVRVRVGSSGGDPSHGRVRMSSAYGQVTYGAANGHYHHFNVDSGPSKFYFSHPCEASGGFSTYSDENLKKDIKPLTGALDDVAKMNGITFKWKDADNRGGGSTGKQFGVTAQNMLTVDSELPTLNKDPLYNIKDGIDENDEYYTMDYARLSPYFIEAIKELKTKLEAAEARITELEG